MYFTFPSKQLLNLINTPTEYTCLVVQFHDLEVNLRRVIDCERSQSFTFRFHCIGLCCAKIVVSREKCEMSFINYATKTYMEISIECLCEIHAFHWLGYGNISTAALCVDVLWQYSAQFSFSQHKSLISYFFSTLKTKRCRQQNLRLHK